ncbi:MAG: hypothetical protein IKC05_07485 [Lentisphaeria bacterium]|nr:hypothetical protein [Lentisphaeria bacterium]
MLFKHEWNDTEQEIISALSKSLRNCVYQKYEDFFIESALHFFMAQDKNLSFGSLWEKVIEKRSIISRVSDGHRGGDKYELWRLQFFHALTALQSFQKGVFGKDLKTVSRIIQRNSSVDRLPERLQDPCLIHCIEQGECAKIIFYLDTLKKTGERLKNVYNMLLNRGKYSAIVDLYKYFGSVEIFFAKSFFARLKNIQDKLLREEFVKCCCGSCKNDPAFWRELFYAGYLPDFLILCLENGISAERTLFDFGILDHYGLHEITLQKYLYLLDELSDVLPQVLEKSAKDVFSSRLSRLLDIVPQFVKWEESRHAL